MADRYFCRKTKNGATYYYLRESGKCVPKSSIDKTILRDIKPIQQDVNTKIAIDLIKKKEALQKKIEEEQRKLDDINIELGKLNIKTKNDENDVKTRWEQSNIPKKPDEPDMPDKNGSFYGFDYQQFSDNYNAKNKTNFTADYWKKEFEPPKYVPKKPPNNTSSEYKPDTSYSNTHTNEKYSTNSNNTNASPPKSSSPPKPSYSPPPKPSYSPPPHPISPEMKNPADMCNSKSHFPPSILLDNKIITKQEWKSWLKQHHVDKGGDATICGYVIAAGRNKGW